MTDLNKLGKGFIRILLLLEFELAIQLVSAIPGKRFKFVDEVRVDVSDGFHSGVGLLPLDQRVPQARVHSDDLVQIPEDLLNKCHPTVLGNDVERQQWLDERLSLSKKKSDMNPQAEYVMNSHREDTPFPSRNFFRCRSPRRWLLAVSSPDPTRYVQALVVQSVSTKAPVHSTALSSRCELTETVLNKGVCVT